MAKDQATTTRFRYLCYILVYLSTFSSISLIYWSYSSDFDVQNMFGNDQQLSINLLTYPSAWNHLTFPSTPPQKLLKIALFVKKWAIKGHAGGLERHALTLHLTLAKRGHELHVFTTSPPNTTLPEYPMIKSLFFHLTKPSAAGYLDQASVWNQFVKQNLTGKPFDVIHTESVGLRYTRSRNISNLAVSWHGIAYETIHSDIIQELLRSPEDSQNHAITERTTKVVEEVKFFPNYAHHVATSDHAGDVLRRIYMIPEERIHIILNGIDEEIFKPDSDMGNEFKKKVGISDPKKLVFGIAGRLVKDKGHPLMHEALKQIFLENSTFRDNVIVLVAGDGPWGARYKDLGTNLLVLGPLEQAQLASFYNAIDIFVNPTLRAQGLDHTLLEAILSGKPVMATKFASITGSVIVGEEVGYTFSPTVSSLKESLYKVWKDGKQNIQQKGKLSRERGLNLFTATKMAACYERLFLCISYDDKKSHEYCQYEHQGHRLIS
ncbi:putative phosphatidyl-myo-inositol alpha-mannosyltransferase [Heracleum sosnowskyi]|uniref:Phosphatidyl-myo-inositol alpha-mannosyltransferase n=1 Tax=Heracleum sosnowskyi TaxID=360622 RepID=A0AAD8IZL9_9APIA|nr:putative phosphatidyl-myo-inositol alpha-mannosyltransferase [Heracleum sosnowskyi]